MGLWGGPLDGGTVYLPPGELPATVCVHTTRRGELVGIRGRVVPGMERLPLYEQTTHATTGRAVYVYGPVVARWRDQGVE